MANFQEVIRTYETLLRHNADGSVSAHHQKISEVIKDGIVISATVLSPEPIKNIEKELSPIISQLLIDSVAHSETLEQKLRDAEVQITQLSSENQQLKKLLNS